MPTLTEDQIAVVKAHLSPAWPTVVRAIQRKLANGARIGDLALILIDNQIIPFDERRSSECLSRGGFSDGQTVAEVLPLVDVARMAEAAGPNFPQALSSPGRPNELRVYALVALGPVVATVHYDPDTLTPAIGDA